ncbi:LamB/YcsF family protein [Blastococcus sp. VKM Ac-2987]|uniref:LamB/YcsF family protein n=1 Tax=Blastococcus sp. VKM Ac-2987 TaxID=3004141 RepID=UPI0022AB5A2E|nr:LamB/YcsF family protein [Blastococcus sp. VKM Ac-2987]MCZ2857909.1 LamB/YcsF family protein [Blastococcus sp. VKM Ac-2987]
MSAPGARRIDLNADLGEGFGVWRLGDDDALLGVVSSANVACGFHAGDPVTMRRVCAAAVAGGVAIGAQMSYGDLTGFGRRLAVLGLPGSALLGSAAAAGLPTVGEGFADRGYAPDGTLVPRGAAGALVHDPAAVAGRAVGMATDGTVVAVDGSTVRVDVRSVCVHGDTPGAVELARAVRSALEAAGLRVGPFAA